MAHVDCLRCTPVLATLLLLLLVFTCPPAAHAKCYVLSGTLNMRHDWIMATGTCANIRFGCEHVDMDAPGKIRTIPNDATVVIYADSHGNFESVAPHSSSTYHGPHNLKFEVPSFTHPAFSTKLTSRAYGTHILDKGGIDSGIMGAVLAGQLAMRLPASLPKLILQPCSLAEHIEAGTGFFVDFSKALQRMNKFDDLTIYGALGPNVEDITATKIGHGLVFKPDETNPDPYTYNNKINKRLAKLWSKQASDVDVSAMCHYVDHWSAEFNKALMGFQAFKEADAYPEGFAKLRVKAGEALNIHPVYVANAEVAPKKKQRRGVIRGRNVHRTQQPLGGQ